MHIDSLRALPIRNVYIISLLFILIIRSTPTSTLFPYTTLFRSSFGDVNTFSRFCRQRLQSQNQKTAEVRRHSYIWTPRLVSLDRKSTRLNSSHTVISYAVFCLKKKTRPSADEAPAGCKKRLCRY